MSEPIDAIERDPRAPWLLSGPGAVDALAGHIATSTAQSPDTAVFAFRIGRHARGTDPDRLAYRLLAWLREVAGHREPLPTAPEAIAERLPNWLARAASARPLLVAVADVGRLGRRGDTRFPRWMLDWRPPRASIVLADAATDVAGDWAAASGRVLDAGPAAACAWPEPPATLDAVAQSVLDEAWRRADAGEREGLRDWLCQPRHVAALNEPAARYDLHRWLRELAPALGGGAGVLAPLRERIAAIDGAQARTAALLEMANLLGAVDGEADPEPLLREAVALDAGAPAAVLALATRLNAVGRHDEAIELVEPALQAWPADADASAQARHQRAIAAESLGDLATAERLYQQSLKLLEDAAGPQAAGLLPHLANLAGVLQARQDPQAARPWRERAADIARRVHGEADPRTASALDALAGLHYALGDPTAAAKHYRDALRVVEAAFGPHHPATAAALHNLGTTLDALSDYSEAEAMHRRALAIREARLGRIHEDTAASRHNLASVLDERGRKDEAETMYREAIEDWRQLVGDDHPATATSRNNLADLLAERGDPAAAEPLYRANLRSFSQRYGDEHPHTLITCTELGATLCMIGQATEGEALLRGAIDASARILGETSLGHVDALCKLAVALHRRGRTGEARALLDAAISRLEPKLGVISPRMLRLQRHREALDRESDPQVH